MIHKIDRLISIGKFYNYQATGDVSFKKMTLIYADNGAGKTTLASVFRSLADNNLDIIQKRISINATAPQAAQIIRRDATGTDTFHTFRTTGWSNPPPVIETFDIHFINDNIYSGFDFSDDHKKGLHDFVIGAQGVAIRQQIEQNKTDKSTSRLAQTSLENQIIQLVQNGLTSDLMAAFLNITTNAANNLDAKIEAAKKTLLSSKANTVIQTLPLLAQLCAINTGIDFDTIITDIETTTQTIQDQSLREIYEAHCAELSSNSIESAETWIGTGFGYLETKGESNRICPFCKQNLDNNLDIIKAYSLNFNIGFNALIQRINLHLNALHGFNTAVHIQAIGTVLQTNLDRSLAWAKHLPDNVTQPTMTIFPEEGGLISALENAVNTLKNKSSNPSVSLDTTSISNLKSLLEEINNNIITYNKYITAYNSSINTFRAGIITEQQAQKNIDSLHRIKKRHEPTVNALCLLLAAEKLNLKTLEQAYPLLIQQQQIAATTFFNTYRDRINHYLGHEFRTPFRIEGVDHIPPKGKATRSRIEYHLTLNGHRISCDVTQPNSTRECLSEGDKSTIALAFFLSKIDIDPDINNIIVLIDDPLSSFDSNRRSYTVKIVKELIPRVKQIIVLSHHEFFLSALSEGVVRAEKKTLRVCENFTTGCSTIVPLDLDALVKIEYFRHIEELDCFLVTPDINNRDRILGLMRNVLEAHIRFKFYRQLSGMPQNQGTFGKLIDELERQNVIFRNDTTPPSIISKLRMINAVSWKPHHGDPVPDYAGIGMNLDTITVTELAHLVQDTLELVDIKL